VRESASSFGELLREFRIRAGLSQNELAEKANVSEDAVGALERGVRKAPYRNTVALLARALELDAGESAALESARVAARQKPLDNGAPHNLRGERTSFVGREADVEHVVKLLRRSRLVSITGSGGVGKTRVALETARRVLGNAFPQAWFVDLGPLIDGDFIVAKIAEALGLPLGSRPETLASLAAALEKRHALLVFDNCEHLIGAVAQTADTILENCSGVTILATSRERLNVAGEFVYRLPSLLLEPAIDLFAERAGAADPQFAIDTANSPAITDIVRRLGGIPLALELTAAQVPLLGLDVLRARLYEHLRLASGRRDLPARQQTVLATIEWSYNLLSPQEQAFLCDVCAFAGSFSVKGAQVVYAATTVDTTLSLLSSLANKSLVSADMIGDRVRYALLESVRAFGLERLGEDGCYDAVARRPAEWFAAIADEVENTVSTMLPERAAELMPEFDNIRAAVSWSLGASKEEDRVLGARIISGFFGLWDLMGRRREHRQWIENALARIDERRYPLTVTYLLRDFMLRTQVEQIALEPIERAVAVGERSGDPVALAKLLSVIAQVQATHGLAHEAEGFLTRARDLLLAHDGGNSTSYCSYLLAWSFACMLQGRLDEARSALSNAEAITLGLGHRYTVVRHFYLRGAEIEYVAGNKRLALDWVQRMIDSEFGTDPAVAVLALPRIAVLRLLLGDVEGALAPLRELLALVRDGHGNFTYIEIEYSALALALSGEAVAAARMLGVIRAQEKRAEFRRLPMRRDAYALLCSALRTQLNDKTIDRACADGEGLTLDEAIDAALTALASK
jgi:predicted ATPase/DNA-binding XRE family transcriptional regulator